MRKTKRRGLRASQVEMVQYQTERPLHEVTERERKEVVSLYQQQKTLTQEAIIRSIAPILSTIPYFQRICPPTSTLSQLLLTALPGFHYEHHQQGKAIFHIGERGDKFYIILEGQAAVYVPKSQEQLDRELEHLQHIQHKYPLKRDEKQYRHFFRFLPPHQLEQEIAILNIEPYDSYFNSQNQCLYKNVHVFNSFESFGDTALSTDKPRTATIVALTELHLISTTKLEFRKISERQMQKMQEKFDFFQQIFSGVSKHVLGKISQYFKDLEMQQNMLVWSEGDESEYCLMIKKGSVSLAKHNQMNDNFMVDTQRQIKYCYVTEGMVGHEEILKQQKRFFTCKVQESVTGYVINAEDLQYICKMFPEVQRRMIERTTAKLSWLKSREASVLQTNEKQTIEFQSIGKPIPKPPERVGLKELQKLMEDSYEGPHIITKHELIDLKEKLHEAHLRRTEFLIGKKISRWNFEETPGYELIKLRVANKLSQDRRDPMESIRRSVSNHMILPRCIIKNFSSSIRKGSKAIFSSVTGQPSEGHYSPRRVSDYQSSQRVPMTERKPINSFKESAFITDMRLNNSSTKEHSRSPSIMAKGKLKLISLDEH